MRNRRAQPSFPHPLPLRIGRFSASCIILASLTFSLIPAINGIRGPHHPKGIPQDHPEPHHQHHHYVPQRQDGEGAPSPKLTQDKQLLHDKEHLKDDMGDWLFTDGKELSNEEMEFHYFKIHDFDNNSKLDGLEILQAISHVLPIQGAEVVPESRTHFHSPSQAEHEHFEATRKREEDFNYYIDLIDKVLEDDDLDKDGYLSYAEYVVGKRRDDHQMTGT